MNNKPSILIIDDEVQIRRLLEITLTNSGYSVLEASNGREGIRLAATYPPAIILLDLGLPDEDGQDILIKLREWYLAPIIILSVRKSEEEIVTALDHGANDYLVKPFRTGELVARIRNLLRLTQHPSGNAVITSGDVSINLAAHVVKKKDTVVHLTALEFSLLSLLARNQNKVLTHQYILREIWGPGYVEQSQYLRVFIAQLRKKLENVSIEPSMIITEPAIGYRFVGDEEQ